ncbi:MAG: hypothetical protein O7F76_10650 [Planctomycetota bacterium]|nr:hypothetical protein [Planctomycetota bacterium]
MPGAHAFGKQVFAIGDGIGLAGNMFGGTTPGMLQLIGTCCGIGFDQAWVGFANGIWLFIGKNGVLIYGVPTGVGIPVTGTVPQTGWGDVMPTNSDILALPLRPID